MKLNTLRLFELAIVTIALCALTTSHCPAQSESTADKESAKAKKAANAAALAKFVKVAGDYDLRLIGASTPFALQKKSILNWTNPARRGENGAIFLWFQKGRPQVIGSIFTYVYANEVHDKHEFHSLATKKIELTINGEKVWHPSKPGVEFNPVPRAPAPKSTTKGCDLQAKLLARRFSGSMVDGQSGVTSLRLVPRPLVTYSPKEGDCKYGAIFSLAYGTDPEVLVLLESRETSGGKLIWHYALARYHYNELSVTLDRKQVWSAQREIGYESKLRSNPDLRNLEYISFKPI